MLCGNAGIAESLLRSARERVLAEILRRALRVHLNTRNCARAGTARKELGLRRGNLKRADSRHGQRRQSEIVGADAGKAGLVPACVLKRQKVKRLVLLQRTA